MGKKRRRPGTSEELEEQLDEWLADNKKEEMQLQPRGWEGQPEAEGGEGVQLKLMSREEELPPPPDPRASRANRRGVQWRSVRLLMRRQPHPSY